MTKTTITHLTCEYHTNPLSIDIPAPRLSWRFTSGDRAVEQAAYQILVAESLENLQANRGTSWDSGKVTTGDSIQQPYGGVPLVSGERYYWKVRAWLRSDQVTPWSEPAFWEMGLLNPSDWHAVWITADSPQPDGEPRSPLLRKTFQLDHPVTSARVYATALGLYELSLNGQRVGADFFTPGWTSYHTRLQYQTYDVTEMLQSGENVLGAILGDGWYRGRLAWQGERAFYGPQRSLLLQLDIRGPGGERTVVTSDPSWTTMPGPILASDIYDGEIYDARLALPGWSAPGYEDRGWLPVETVGPPPARLVAPVGPPVRIIDEIRPQAILHSPAGETIFDFGQNMIGCVRLKLTGASGTTVTLRHAEVLDAAGNLYTENLRSAQQRVQYTLKGEGVETYQPRFSFQGFRFVAVEGYPDEPALDSLTGVVLHSDLPVTGGFSCSNPKINRLFDNILWSQKDNFLDVPTDCPQRDERLGWTGDAQVFAATAAFNMDVAGFFTKWLHDLAADQRPDGSVPYVVPDILPDAGSSAWGDAATIVPWVLYQFYGDRRILAEQYESMHRWVEYMHIQSGENLIWDSGFHFGDWLASVSDNPLTPNPMTNTEFIATAFFAHSAHLLAQTAAVLGKREESEKYQDLFDAIKQAFNREFVTPAGRIGSHTQASYVLALMFDLLPEPSRKNAVDRLVALIHQNEGHFSTGFVSTPYICPVLTRFGYLDVAYDLLNQETPPSWLYPVNQGATTIWERWDSLKPDGSFQDPAMNSFNHYAYGAIGEWLYQTVAGIRPGEPGFKRIIIQPRPGGGLKHTRASYISLYGEIVSSWQIDAGRFNLEVCIPGNTRAEVRLPDGSPPMQVGSGQYQFNCPWNS